MDALCHSQELVFRRVLANVVHDEDLHVALARLEVETEATEGSGQGIADSRQLLKILRRLRFANGNSRPDVIAS